MFHSEAWNEDGCRCDERQDKEMRREAPPELVIKAACDNECDKPDSDPKHLLESNRRHVGGPAREEPERGRCEEEASSEDQHGNAQRKELIDARALSHSTLFWSAASAMMTPTTAKRTESTQYRITTL